jgi:hypothetical protein
MTLQVQAEDNFENMLTEIETMQKQSKALLQSKHYQAMGEAGIFALLQKAKSLNMNPIEALNGGLYYVQGKVGMSTEAMASMIRSKGHSIIKDPKSNDNVCILHGKRADNGDTWICSFSIDDARRAGLFKGVFEKYPSIMCYNRACSMLARQLFPDVIKGAGYTFDELKEIAESKSNPYHNTALVQQIEMLPSEPVKPEVISFEDAQELISIFDECDPEYKKGILEWIKQPPHNAASLFELPKSLYVKCRVGALGRQKEWLAKQSQVVEIKEEEK